ARRAVLGAGADELRPRPLGSYQPGLLARRPQPGPAAAGRRVLRRAHRRRPLVARQPGPVPYPPPPRSGGGPIRGRPRDVRALVARLIRQSLPRHNTVPGVEALAGGVLRLKPRLLALA